MALVNAKKGEMTQQTIEQWCLDLTLVAALKNNSSEYIRAEAEKARKEKWSRKCLTTRRILNLIRKSGNPQELLLETYENMKESSEKGTFNHFFS